MSQLSKLNDLRGFGNGISLVLKSCCRLKTDHLSQLLQNRNIKNDIDFFKSEAESQLSKLLSESPADTLKTVANKAGAFYEQTNKLLRSDLFSKQLPNFFVSKRSIHLSVSYRHPLPRPYFSSHRNLSDDSTKKTQSLNLKDAHTFEHKVS